MPATRRVTIADVASAAGVGVGTVSRVLNGSVHVRAATISAVHEAIDTLGYRPSHAAAALVRGTPRTVALVATHLTRPSAVARVAGALAELEEQGYEPEAQVTQKGDLSLRGGILDIWPLTAPWPVRPRARMIPAR